jgi:hypothetical protein
MLRLRTPKSFGERKNKSNIRLPNRVFVIACEGKTEETYFKAFDKPQYRIYVKSENIQVEVLEKQDEKDTKSFPTHVIALLEEYQEYFGADNEELWLVIDRDKQNLSKRQLEEIISKCGQKNYNIALSNPCFELWLLLHVKDLATYSTEELNSIKQNKKERAKSKKRFLEKELSKLLDGYKKEKIQPKKFLPSIDLAIKQAKSLLLKADLAAIDDFGTTVYILVEKIAY